MKKISEEALVSLGRTILLLAIGSLIYSLGMNIFFVKAHLLGGGVAGIAMLVNYQFHVPTSLMIIAINVPMFFIGWFFVSKKFVLLSLVGMAIFSGSIELFSSLTLPFTSPLTSVVCGGLLTGLGLGLIYRSGASVGGTDIIAKLLHKYLSMNMAVTGLCINASIILISAFLYGLDQAILTVCALYIATTVNTYIIDGIDHRRSIMIVTEHKKEVADVIMEELGRGVTVIDSHGAYSGRENAVLYVVIHKRQLQHLKMIVRKADPLAFFTITTVNGVYGHGHSFVPMEHIDI